ncbi:TolC family protein [Candidatus Cytomitobacter primus]|uniref:TolC family protein n=1 Tax=Candidatus Cytomitobacter primus TaxID=2066024 RepID=A0A5C0UFF4_9PROT|nr:TolC family protein [Candidatus Cytomitobacter primus]QEK38447.1 hypothetical protein FZC34_00745 [Candidatus Cytomitobacter primus]
MSIKYISNGILALTLCASSSLIANKSNNNNKINAYKAKNKQYNNKELNFISSGDISAIEEWASQVIQSDNYVKYIRAQLSASKAKNASSILSFLPSIDSQLTTQHKFMYDGKSIPNNKFRAKWHNKQVQVHLLKIKNSIITDIAAANIKSKADLEEYWSNWSKFCLEEVVETLIDWICQKATVNLKNRIVQSRRHLVKQIKARIQTGTMNISDLHTAEAELSNSEIELFVNQNQEKVLRHKLEVLSPGTKLPEQVGSIPHYGNWDTNKTKILFGSHDLKKEYYSKKHIIASSGSGIMNMLPSFNLDTTYSRKSGEYSATHGRTGAKWQGSIDLSLTHHLGLDSMSKMIEGGQNINAAKLKYLESVRKTITAGYNVFANLENSKKELQMHNKSLNHHEAALKSKKSLFLNDIDLAGKRRISIDDVIMAENSVLYAYTRTIDAYQKTTKGYFKLMHMRGELANRIGNRKVINKSFEKSVYQARQKVEQNTNHYH